MNDFRKALNSIPGVRRVTRKDGIYKFIYSLNGTLYTFLILDRLPYEIPKIFIICKHNECLYIPHLTPAYDLETLYLNENLGYSICYLEESTVLFDTTAPNLDLLFVKCVILAIKVVEDGLNNINDEDWLSEWPIYLLHNRKHDIVKANSFVNLNDYVCRLNAYCMDESVFIYDEYIIEHNEDILRYDGGIHIPLSNTKGLKPPHFFEAWNQKTVRNFITRHAQSDILEQLSNIMTKKVNYVTGKFIVIFSFTGSNDEKQAFGLEFTLITKKLTKHLIYSNPLLTSKYSFDIRFLNIERFDRKSLLPRGGANLDLYDKRVVLIGCGSIGATVAFELARAGIGELLLIDPDILRAENIYRHQLGMDSVLSGYYLKADLIKMKISNMYPFINVNSIKNKLEDIIHDEFPFHEFDLVISLTGNAKAELLLDTYLHSKRIKTPALYGWIEAYGIGGQALLVNDIQSSGCLHCTFCFDENYGLASRVSFFEPGQNFAKQSAGCGSLYLPYSSLDAQNMALIITRIAIDSLLKKTRKNPLTIWKGKPNPDAISKFLLTDRYFLSQEALDDLWNCYHNECCFICGHGRN